MTFDEALKILNIEDYKERIIASNSNGELFHLSDYIVLAEVIMAQFGEGNNGFREVFEQVVSDAKQTWQRPESIYQHILRIFQQSLPNAS